MKLRSAVLLFAGLFGSIQSCAQPGASDGGGPTPAARATALSVAILQHTNQCGSRFSQPTALWIDTPERLAQIYQGFPVLPPPAPPAVDFTRQGVLLITMGQRPTAGYGLSLLADSARLREGVLTVGVDWQEPRPGYMLAQMLTTPCLLLQLPAVSFHRIQVVDRQGQVRLSASR